jgi:hypothetical protein
MTTTSGDPMAARKLLRTAIITYREMRSMMTEQQRAEAVAKLIKLTHDAKEERDREEGNAAQK